MCDHHLRHVQVIRELQYKARANYLHDSPGHLSVRAQAVWLAGMTPVCAVMQFTVHGAAGVLTRHYFRVQGVANAHFWLLPRPERAR